MGTWLLLKVLHVVFGIFWAGSLMFLALYLLPSVRAAGPAAGPVMRQLLGVRRLHIAFVVASWVTVITGVLFYVRLGLFSGAPLLASWHGRALVLGSISGLLALAVGAIVQAPAGARMNAIAASLQGPPTPEQLAEIRALQDRTQGAGWAGALLVVLAVAGMALSHPI